MSTKIAWTDETWNPIVGCSKVSEGCRNCYAERMAVRLAGHKAYRSTYGTVIDRCMPLRKPNENETLARWNGETALVESALDKPLHWRKPRRVFVCSMGDLFHESVPDERLDRVMEAILNCPRHTFQVLTKRPQRAKAYVEMMAHYSAPAPPGNVWLGVTAENQRCWDERVPILKRTPCVVDFVSCEPLLSSIETRVDQMPRWLVIGCESGPGRRPCKLEWVRDLVQQCRSASVPVFVKQLDIGGKVSHDPAEWPEDLRVREYPA